MRSSAKDLLRWSSDMIAMSESGAEKVYGASDETPAPKFIKNSEIIPRFLTTSSSEGTRNIIPKILFSSLSSADYKSDSRMSSGHC